MTDTWGANSGLDAYPAAVEALDVRKTYGSGVAETVAVAGITARFEKGRFTAIVGPSGSGKTTLLHLLAGLDAPTSGRVIIDGTDISTLSDDALSDLRRDRIGFIFQDFNLLPYLTAEQNIELPFTLRGRQPDRQAIRGIARELGIENRLDHKPQEMSARATPARGGRPRAGQQPRGGVRRRADRSPGREVVAPVAGNPAGYGDASRADDRDGHA